MLEINRSKYGMADYRVLIGMTNRMQQDLIGLYNTVRLREMAPVHLQQSNTAVFRERFMPGIEATMPQVRREVGRVIQEISAVLGNKMEISELQDYEAYRSDATDDSARSSAEVTLVDPHEHAQKQEGRPAARSNTLFTSGYRSTVAPEGHHTTVSDPIAAGLGSQLDREVGLDGAARAEKETNGYNDLEAGKAHGNGSGAIPVKVKTPEEPPMSKEAPLDPLALTEGDQNHPLMKAHFVFRQSQQDVIAELLEAGLPGHEDDRVNVQSPGVPLSETWSAQQERVRRARAEVSNRKKGRLPKATNNGSGATQSADDLSKQEDPASAQERLLLGITSFAFLGG